MPSQQLTSVLTPPDDSSSAALCPTTFRSILSLPRPCHPHPRAAPMSVSVSSSFSHTSSTSLAASISCSFQLSPASSCHFSPTRSSSPAHSIPPHLSSGDYRPAPFTPPRPSLSISTTYFSSSSASSTCSAVVHSSSPRSPAPAPVRPSSAPSPSLHRSRSPVAQLTLAYSSSVMPHPTSTHHPFLHRPCSNDSCTFSPSSSSCAAQPLLSSAVCRPGAASSNDSCHAAFDCARMHIVKRYSDHSEYEGSAITQCKQARGVFSDGGSPVPHPSPMLLAPLASPLVLCPGRCAIALALATDMACF